MNSMFGKLFDRELQFKIANYWQEVSKLIIDLYPNNLNKFYKRLIN